MIIEKDKVVKFQYAIKDVDGALLESSEGQAAAYLHGHNNMMPGIEDALQGKQKGDSFSVELAPQTTFGEKQENAVQRVPIKHLQGAKVWKPGMTAVVQTEQGHHQVTIIKLGKFMATVDVNHPLAGKTLNFELSVEDVRDATQEEIAHGHAHGEGGHQH